MTSSKLIIKIILKREWLNLVLDIDFMTSNILKLDFFLHISWIHYKLEGNLYDNIKIRVILSYIKQIIDNYMFNIPT
jgi:hypothetical protein